MGARVKPEQFKTDAGTDAIAPIAGTSELWDYHCKAIGSRVMRWGYLSGSMVAVFLTCTLASGAGALPLAGTGQAVAPTVQLAAHKPNHWYWSGHWWRPGPWSDHAVHGVINRRGHDVMFLPWRGPERLRYCASKYRNFDPATGTYVTWRGKRRVCH